MSIFGAGTARCAEIKAPSALHTNLGPMPIDHYDSTLLTALTGYPDLKYSCPGQTTVRGCYQASLMGFAAQQQHVSGVRFFFDICGGANSTPLQNCGSGNYKSVTGPNAPWTTNLQNFFLDIYNAGIHSVSPTMGHDDGIGLYGGAPFGLPTWYVAPSPPPSRSKCTNTPAIVQYVPGLPYAQFPCTQTPPYSCPTNVQNCGAYCVSGAGYPVDDSHNGYNCSPTNPYFVGWQNTYNVWNFVIEAAYNTPTAGAKGLNIEELDVQQELNTLQFPVEARLIVDNSRTDTGNPDNLNSIRYSMNLYGYDQERVTWSSIAPQPTVAGAVDCGSGYSSTDVYADYPRNIFLDSRISGISGGAWIGWPNPTCIDGLCCGGSTASMYLTTYGSHSPLPDIVDEHIYPCIINTTTGQCWNTEPNASVQLEAYTFFSEIPHYLSASKQQSAVFMLGETHTYSNDGHNETCDVDAPLTAAASIVAAYDQTGNGLAGNNTVVIRPFINLAYSCFTPSNQLLNPNNAGPYTPSIQQ